MMNFTVFVFGCLMLTYSCNGSMEEIVGELQRELQQLKMKTGNEIQALKTSITTYENEIQLLKTSSAIEIEILKEEINTLKVERLNGSEVPKRRFVLGTNSFAEKPAFSASLTNHATSLSNFQTIIFDNVFTNDLRGYSGITGIFTAPMNGTYFFTATVMSHSGEYLETEICMNGKSLVSMYSYDTHFEQGTNSVVLVLKTGDKVWVRHSNTQGSKAFGYHWSAFSGFMI
ncbi:Complement C1q tumor necrosis factor-related protein 6 [Mactra antiquata]